MPKNNDLRVRSSVTRPKEKIIRITVVGDGATGKTCLLIVYKDKKYDDRYIPTIFDEYSMTIPINYEPYTIILSDTAGQEEFDKLRQLAYRFADAFILCYSITERSSFDNIQYIWAPELKRFRSRASIILVATKIDLLANRVVTTEEGEALAREIGAAGFIETSAKKQWNIDAAFQMALWSVVSNRRASSRPKSQCSLL
ncbi:ras-like GTP-binding protein RhoL [Rhynchophorus ferrugineus]|uniref:ras-like GTP-binding protein RhoL n=1 Tax=Rhynchophorus ferrugineus TaxID=354439 RepID=UPI003FCE3631